MLFSTKKLAVWAVTGVVAFGGMAAMAAGPQARALREKEERRDKAEAERDRKHDKNDHPEVWVAIKQLRDAREQIVKSKHEKERYKSAALAAIDAALTECEALMARD
ncbi:MAG TPA: hypothetical protein VEA69_20830 [Tepidisphaeraceae bacterium]|nr:hypothetical protein [Tepidisphaeraceae bacterium]